MMISGHLLITPDGEFAKLGPVEAGIIRELVKAKMPLNRSQLIERVYLSDSPLDQSTIVVLICRLNHSKLKHVGLRIKNLAGRGVRDGLYSLVKA